VKFIDEYRDPVRVQAMLRELESAATRPWVIMEICGGQTHSFLQHGLDAMLPQRIELVHGPGCPVCVTPLEQIDKAIAIARQPNVTFASYGDMLRVPGSRDDLFSARASGGDVRVVYSPLEAVEIAEKNQDREVVFFAIGFETTAPPNAAAVEQASRRRLNNFSVLVSHVCVPPAMEAILGSASCRVQAFLAAGHVCAVMGYHQYVPIAMRHHVPIVVTGFEPVDLLRGLLCAVRQLETSTARAENAYTRMVTLEGNRAAQAAIDRVFVPVDRKWRGIGLIPLSGLGLRPEFAAFDAERRFHLADVVAEESPICIAGEILQGKKKPPECSAFGTVCNPQHPLGAPMVSAEGACAAYHRYHPEAATHA